MHTMTRKSVWSVLRSSLQSGRRGMFGASHSIVFRDLLDASSFDASLCDFGGRSVLISTIDPFTSGLALIELDGVARRIVLCPAGIALDQLPAIVRSAEVDIVVSDRSEIKDYRGQAIPCVLCGPALTGPAWDRSPRQETEWVLLTSGSTGQPKLVVHTLATLAGGIEHSGSLAGNIVWGTFYDIRRYGGLQIFLRALLTGGSLVISNAEETTSDFLTRAAALGVSHISGTPSHWRKALMSPS